MTSLKSQLENIAFNAMSSGRDSQHMLALGSYRFSLDTATYQEFRREISFLWPTQQTFGGWAKPQFVGVGEYRRSLSGTIYPEFRGGFGQVEAMLKEAGQGKPLQLVTGTGDVLGFWNITKIQEDSRYFERNGQPKKLEFSLELLFYGDRYAV